MAKEDISREPQNIDADNWYYEEVGGITAVHGQVQIFIPWAMLKRSMRRRFKHL